MGSKWARQPEVQAKVRELQDAADGAVSLRLAEAQRLLAETARLSPRTDPTHSERIAAIKAHADLSGWTKTEGITVNIGQVLGALGPPVRPVHSSLDTITISPPTPVREQSERSEPAIHPPAPDGVGCPNDPAVLRAMHPYPQSESPSGFFTKAVSGVFTNELGEMEVGSSGWYDDTPAGHEKRRMERKLP